MVDMNIAKRFQEEAKKDRVKLAVGATVLALLLLAVRFVISQNVDNPFIETFIYTPVLFVFVGVCTCFAFRLIKKMEHDSFGEGMHLIMESVPMPLFMLDQKSKLIYCNNSVLKLFGLSSKEEYYKQFFSFMPEYQADGRRSSEAIDDCLKKAWEEGVVTFNLLQKIPTCKEDTPAQITFVKVFFEGEDHFVGFIKDKRQAFALKKQEEAFRQRAGAIMDASPLLCAVFDKDSNVIEVNKAAEHLFGIPDRQIFVNRFNNFLPETQPDGANSFERSVETLNIALKEGSFRHEFWYQDLNGNPVPAEEFLHRIETDKESLVISFSRDLRDYYREKEKDKMVQQGVQSLSAQLNGHVSEQAAAVTQAAAAIEEMVANVESVTGALSKNAEHVRDLQAASEVGHNDLNDVAVDIRRVAEESESIMEINSVMSSIASQTNLLSMNAAIEAAHAGEAGRGFAVVADEIRKLAESSSNQSKTISTVLKNIKTSIDKITKSTENVLNKFDAIDEGITIVANQEGTMLNAMEEQKHGSKEVLRAISRVSEITTNVKNDAQYLVESNTKILNV